MLPALPARWSLSLVLLLAGVLLAGCGLLAPAAPANTGTGAIPAEIDGIPTVAASDLPPEARATMRLIASNGPFPYNKDGSTFQNREGLLPDQPVGYYREYTVETPGSPDRGARRIVGGERGELYYTDDHYASFRRIVE